MPNFKMFIDDINTKYQTITFNRNTGKEVKKTVYPSEKEGAFLFSDSDTYYHIISYKWFNRYDDVNEIAIFSFIGGMPYHIKISKDDLKKYIPNDLLH